MPFQPHPGYRAPGPDVRPGRINDVQYPAGMGINAPVMTLDSIPLLRNLDRNELQVLRMIVKEVHFAAGAEIFREDAPGDGVYFVKNGLVEISSLVGVGDRRVFSRLGPGEIFGEMAMIEHQPRSAGAIAIQDTDVFFLPRGEILSFLQRSPALAFDLLQLVSHRLREFTHLYLREVVQAERLAAVGKLARSIIHDLKNPLSIIGLSAEMLDRPNLAPEARARAQARIRKQVERISDMVGDILLFTEGKAPEMETKPVSFRTYVLDLIADLRGEAELKNARIELQNEPPAVLVPFNPRRLGRVFSNLVHNATDMMPDGGTIYLRFQCDEKEIVTEVEDTGPGIAPEIAGQLFEVFATFGKAQGTGLGLSICKKIIEDHKGRIWARNEPGRGAVFAFALPLP
jgi:signal transduction histidine kinase